MTIVRNFAWRIVNMAPDRVVKKGRYHIYKIAQKYSHTRHRLLLDSEAEAVSPVFVLSTGRSGTNWLATILSSSSKLLVHHEPFPRLFRQSYLTYPMTVSEQNAQGELIRSARDQLIADAQFFGKIYLETNNRMTFLCRSINAAYPNSKFLVLHRHPAEFVRSGIRRGYYISHPFDQFRIKAKDEIEWEQMSQVERIGWLWNSTYSFVEDFLESIPPERQLRIASNKMWDNLDEVNKILDFVGTESMSDAKFRSLASVKTNQETRGNFAAYSDWTAEQKKELRSVCTLGPSYGYQLD